MTPISIAHIGSCCSEIGFEGECRIINECIARETDLIAMAAETAPTMEDERTAVGTIVLHLIEENMITPESFAQTVGVWACEILLPIEPPEIHSLFFKGTDEVLEEGFGKLLIFEFPRDTFLF